MLQRVLVLFAVLGAWAVACAADGDGERHPAGSTSSADGGVGGSAGSEDVSVTTGVGGGIGGGCAEATIVADPIPLAIYVMLDKSDSMDADTPTGTIWTDITGALVDFVHQPDLEGIRMGIQYFGLPVGGGSCPVFSCWDDIDCMGCGPCIGSSYPDYLGICQAAGVGDSCDASDYANPEVPISDLPGAALDLTLSLSSHEAYTSTPTSAALEGAIDYAKTWAAAHPEDITIVVFATDGLPAWCDTNSANIVAMAAAGFNDAPSVRTFAFGVGVSGGLMDDLAVAGGTGQAFFINTSLDPAADFLAAMNTLRENLIGCAFAIPQPESGVPDYDRVNVEYTPGGSTTGDFIPRVDSAALCPDDELAWYYDDPDNPTQIILCGHACDVISPDTDGKVEIVVGCETLVF